MEYGLNNLDGVDSFYTYKPWKITPVKLLIFSNFFVLIFVILQVWSTPTGEPLILDFVSTALAYAKGTL